VLINFQTHAAHCLSTDPDVISSDFVGAMREHLEKEEEFFTVYYQGACGNVNTFARLPQDKEGWPGTYQKVGVAVGEAVKRALSNATELNLDRVLVKTEHLTCTVNHQKTHLAEKAREIQRTSSPEKKQELMDACGIENRYEVSAIIKRSAFGKTREMPLSVLILGDLAMGFAPVELFDACGKAFREASAYPMTFFSGYTNAAHSYMPSATAYPHGGYEALECHYVPGTGEMIALKLAAMVNGELRSTDGK